MNTTNTPTPTGIEAQVCAEIAQRQQHGTEELLDGAIYMKRAMSEIGQSQSFTVYSINRKDGGMLLQADYEEMVSPKLEAGDRVVVLVLKKGG
jgi:hypothetical protein